MGRTQVARNQRRGGRGGRGSTPTTTTTTSKTTKHNKHIVEGDNSFRYQDQDTHPPSEEYNQDEMDWDAMDTGLNATYGPSHDFVQIASMKSPTDEEMKDDANANQQWGAAASMSIDILQLSKCLDNLDRSTFMRLTDRITDIYDDRLGKRSGEEKKLTIAEMIACPSAAAAVSVVESVEDAVSEAVNVLRVTDDTCTETETDSKVQEDVDDEEDDSDDGEDLDAWLDGVIET
mmetsp:Transcript_1295/g.2004  ORF Transcript_1295/g.2004 Transcript_1295/m.2004 type:complete len:233 (-) Transcript_1295:48-746(-)